MKKCPKCNNLVDENSNVCNICGFSFVNEGDDETKKTISDKEKNEPNENYKPDDKLLTNETNKKSQDELNISDNGINPNISNNKKFNKITIIFAFVALISLVYVFYLQNKYNDLLESKNKISTQLTEQRGKNQTLSKQNIELEGQITQLKSENDELANGASNQLSDIKNAFEKGEWQTVVDLSNTLHEKYNGSQEDVEAQNLAKTSQENIDKQKAAEEAEAAKGYETGISYDQLARTPDQFKDKKVKFYGKVIQVIEGDASVQIRLAVDDNYDTILFGEYINSTVSSRVLENDYITIYGTSVGTISYESTLGGTITIPGVSIEKIDQ